MAASVLSNLLILAGGLAAVSMHDPVLYHPQSMQAAFDWMVSEPNDKPLILASPETGLIIPGATGWRVMYGHPYETPNAALREEQVESVYRGELSGAELERFIEENRIDYIFYGPFEQIYGANPELFLGYPTVYSNDAVRIFSTDSGR